MAINAQDTLWTKLVEAGLKPDMVEKLDDAETARAMVATAVFGVHSPMYETTVDYTARILTTFQYDDVRRAWTPDHGVHKLWISLFHTKCHLTALELTGFMAALSFRPVTVLELATMSQAFSSTFRSKKVYALGEIFKFGGREYVVAATSVDGEPIQWVKAEYGASSICSPDALFACTMIW